MQAPLIFSLYYIQFLICQGQINNRNGVDEVMKIRTKIFSWSESKNTSTVKEGVFDTSRKVSLRDIEDARRLRRANELANRSFVVTTK